MNCNKENFKTSNIKGDERMESNVSLDVPEMAFSLDVLLIGLSCLVKWKACNRHEKIVFRRLMILVIESYLR